MQEFKFDLGIYTLEVVHTPPPDITQYTKGSFDVKLILDFTGEAVLTFKATSVDHVCYMTHSHILSNQAMCPNPFLVFIGIEDVRSKLNLYLDGLQHNQAMARLSKLINRQ